MNNSIAIIGVSFELPKIKTWDDLQKSLSDTTSFIGDMPQRRLQEIQKAVGNIEMSKAGYLDEVDKFDNEYFGFTERESVKTFPEHRLFLTNAMRALYHAGYNESMLKGTKTGVFYTASKSAYHRISGVSDVSFGHTDMVAGIEGTRLAKYLDIRGPVMSINTSCSSALVAINVARQSLNEHECDMAVVGGVKILTVTRETSMNNVVHSKKEECRPFDDEADGMMNGEGAVFFVLKRYDEAVRDRDAILGEIRGVGINHGGNRISSLTAPSANAQTEAIVQAWTRAGVDTRKIRYIEAHGTATLLGDPIEIEGIKHAFQQTNTGGETFRCGLSSIKGQIGHLDYLAGLAGLLRMVATLNEKTIPVQPNFRSLNKHFQIDNTGLYIPTTAEAWPDEDGERIGGVSSFGMTGTNVHVVVSRNKLQRPPAPAVNGRYYLQISHRTRQGLDNYTAYIAGKIADMDRMEDIHRLCAKLNRVFQVDKFNRGINYSSKEDLLAALRSAYSPPAERVLLLLDLEVMDYPQELINAVFDENLFIRQAWDEHVAIPLDHFQNTRMTSILFQYAIYKYLLGKVAGLKFITPKGGSILNALLKSEITVGGLSAELEKRDPLHHAIDEEALRKYLQGNLANKAITIIDFSGKDKRRFDDLNLKLRVVAGSLPNNDRFTLYADMLSTGANPMRTGFNPVFNEIDLPYYTLRRFWPEIRVKSAANGKEVAKEAVRAASAVTTPLMNRSEIQKAVRDSWVAVLETEEFNEQDDFFALGGTSLVAMDMIDEIGKRIKGIKISHEKVYTHPTVSQLTEFIFTQLAGAQTTRYENTPAAPQLTRAEVEKTIIECWSLILETDNVNAEDNFFEMGGTSLSALDMVDEIKKRIAGANISYEEIFSCPTVSKMADKIISRLNNGVAPAPTNNGEKQLQPKVREDMYQELLRKLKKEQFHREVPESIFLTGATGLLGMNVLNYLLSNTQARIFCLVRKTAKDSAEERFWSGYEHYFGSGNRERIMLIEGDLYEEGLGINNPSGDLIKAGMIFHIAGSPQFISSKKIEDHINFAGTKNIVDWANRYEIKRLVFISTVGIVGKTMPAGIENFYETDTNLGQQNENLIHGASKLKAEEYINKHYRYKSKTFRIPNIGGRWSDGCFPTDLNKNLMWLRLKSLAGLKYYSQESLAGSSGIGLMPVDILSALIAEISFADVDALNVYHLIHRKYYTNGEVLHSLQRAGFKLEQVEQDRFAKYIATESDYKGSFHQVAIKEHKFELRADATNEVISRLNLDKFLEFDRLQYLDRLITANLDTIALFKPQASVAHFDTSKKVL
jgi:3-oxoacyl-(acyl-carrier-protein) synthase/thioester reductase-like protein/acyl carrier protein